MFDLSGKTALITGSSRGIGRAMAERMAEQGAHVVISSRKADACQSVAEALRTRGLAASAQPCHVGRREEVEAMAAAVQAQQGGIDILVGNAATNPHYGAMGTLTDEAFDKTMDTNVKSLIWLANAVLPGMAEAGGGSVILLSSILGIEGTSTMGTYGLTKAAVAQLARNIAVEWGPRGIRANALAPGLIQTDMAEALWADDSLRHRVESGTPLRRIGQPDDVAGVALFLASAASAYVTGQTLVIDGGGGINERLVH